VKLIKWTKANTTWHFSWGEVVWQIGDAADRSAHSTLLDGIENQVIVVGRRIRREIEEGN
jgi:hypothetical protein